MKKTSLLFVANIPWALTVEELRSLFETYTTVRDIKILVNHDTGRSKGYGFVDCDTVEEAESCINQLNGHAIRGRILNVKWATPRKARGR